ncbi:pentatricopeptide repeat-containing protein At3g09040, mitochondrial-like [Diospyros lotus]|uniref:pentatricopeptide repeat-containing protein At3g09040, mitochondrial-like n=1 Tax=Diospyros lotus TaxID=55363 RepID=UPI002253730D|nr:pentatricopeptide repeat-containing protein At3g09040, mitochondrial-like [Diospyros lotus]XP_052205260.1 pentatricopeptide repeat-containing protein At3g09040, mitochondrial-like [Diospyros lotus]
MKSFGISLSLKSKRSLSLIRSLHGHQYQIYRPKSHSQSYHHHLAVGDTATLDEPLAIATNWKSYLLGTQVHGRVFKWGFSNDTFSQNNLIKMYSECGVLSDGLKVFGEMPKRNLVSWTLIISGAVRNGEFEMSLEVYLEMTRAGLLPNEFALGSVLKASTSMGNDVDRLSLCVHCFALKVGMESNSFVGSSLLNLYAKCGIIEAAERVFEDMDYHDVGCWNAMVGGYVQCGLGFEAIRTLSLMKRDGKLMDNITFINALKGCLAMGDLEFGRQIHGIIVKSKIEQSTSLVNALMDTYFKNAKKGTAFKLFNVMQKRDAVSWNTVFAGLSPDVEAREVATLFSNFMLTKIKPNHLTFSILFRLCSDIHQLNLGLQFLSLAFQFGFYGEAHVASSLINMLSRCGAIKMARLAFDGVHFKNIYNWNELISGYNLICDTEALKVFCQLRRLGIEANECTFSCALEACSKTENLRVGRQIHGIIVKYGFSSHGYICSSLVKGYVKLGLLADAFKFLCELEKSDMVLWSTLISASAHQGFPSEAIKFLNCLKEVGGEPDEFMLGSILNGCAVNASHHQTKSVHSLIIKTGYDTNAFVASAVIDAYAKYGDIESARIAFDHSSKYNDIVLCNTMIMAYANHGMVVEAMELFEKIKLANLKPSQATFVSIMSACNHTGLVDQGHALFKSMTLDYGMEPLPDNYGCLVDLLSRNGYLQDAKDIIEQMPLKPWPAIWRSLLTGCRIHGDRELGEQAARELLQLAPENDAAYVFLLRVYLEDGNWDDAAKVREQMMERGVQKSSGFSWIEI